MRKFLILLMLAFLPTMLFAQSAGGQVVRKNKKAVSASQRKYVSKPKQTTKSKARTKSKSRNGNRRAWYRADWEDEMLMDSLAAVDNVVYDSVAYDTDVCDSVAVY